MELDTINQNELPVKLTLQDYSSNRANLKMPNTQTKIAQEQIEQITISDKIPHLLQGNFITVNNAYATGEIISLIGEEDTSSGTCNITSDILPITLESETVSGLSVTKSDRDIILNGESQPSPVEEHTLTNFGFLNIPIQSGGYAGRITKLKNDSHPVTVTGTSFTITDALNPYAIPSPNTKNSVLQLKGNTSQSSTPTPTSPVEINTVREDNEIVVSGKNIYPIKREYTRTTNGITFTFSNGIITASGTATGNAYSTETAEKPNHRFWLDAGTYVLSGATGSVRLQLMNYENDTSYGTASGIKTYTLEEGAYVYIRANVTNGTALSGTQTIYVQLEKRKHGNNLRTL